MNWFYRQLFQFSDWMFRAYCFARRPTRRGAYVVVWWNQRVLLVRNSYRRVLTLPSGGLRRREAPVDGARRELREEVGLSIDAGDIRLLKRFTLYHDYIHDDVYAFELKFEDQPEIRVDLREVIEARFEPLDNAREAKLSAVAAHILAIYC